MIGATICARNYLAQARIVAESFLAAHPGATFVTLVIDGSEADREHYPSALGRMYLPNDLGLQDREWQQMAAMYSVMEFATALKPALLQTLLERDSDPTAAVCYLDPDILVLQPFPEVFEIAASVGIVLTPHVLEPMPRDRCDPSESALMHSGLFNLGFCCVGKKATEFLAWWHERLRMDAVVDLAEALFTDQRWIDWVPSLFDCHVLRDPGFNVAYWNAHERPLTVDPDGVFLANGSPLRFFHFSGYDPEIPWRLSSHAEPRPRCLLSNMPIVRTLCDEYGQRLIAYGHRERRKAPYGFSTLRNGLKLNELVRCAYRAGITESLEFEVPPPPAPLDSDGGAAFAQWLLASPRSRRDLGLTPFHRALWASRPDLRAAFPDPAGIDAEQYHLWMRHDFGSREAYDDAGFDPQMRQNAAVGTGPGAPISPTPGINVVGYFSAELGVGEAGRRMSRAIESTGTPTAMVAVTTHNSRDGHALERPVHAQLHYHDTLYCVNADSVASARFNVGDRSTRGGRRIGLWFWEIEQFPQHSKKSFEFVDEVWVSSRFTQRAIEAVSPIPVHHVVLPVSAPMAPTPFRRSHIGFPDQFVFHFNFDFHSVFDRKNPSGVIEAYCAAFGPDDGAALVLKSINGKEHVVEVDRVTQAIAHRPDITFHDGYVASDVVQAMLELSDCFVSLHRSEGFGLGMAAAMAAGKPVIATGYSGNMDFMDADSAMIVPFDLVPVGKGNAPYAPDALWAEPNLEVAAEHMRTVFEKRDFAAALGLRARDRVLMSQSLERSAADVDARLTAMRAR